MHCTLPFYLSFFAGTGKGTARLFGSYSHSVDHMWQNCLTVLENFCAEVQLIFSFPIFIYSFVSPPISISKVYLYLSLICLLNQKWKSEVACFWIFFVQGNISS